MNEGQTVDDFMRKIGSDGEKLAELGRKLRDDLDTGHRRSIQIGIWRINRV